MADRDELAATDDDLLETLRADVRAVADELEEEGWETYVLEPARIHVRTARSDLGQGFEIVVPEETIEPIFELVTEDAVAFDGSEVYGITEDHQRLLVVVILAPGHDVAVVTPLAYSTAGAAMLERAAETGQVRTLLRSPDGRTLVVTHDDPDIFRPSVSLDEE